MNARKLPVMICAVLILAAISGAIPINLNLKVGEANIRIQVQQKR